MKISISRSAISGIIATVFALSLGYPAMALQNDEAINTSLCWFSPDTESILVTNGPYHLPESLNEMMKKGSASLTIPFLPVLPASEFHSQKIYQAIAGRQVSLAIEALGPYPKVTEPAILSRGLFVLYFASTEKWDSLIDSLSKQCASVSLHGDHKVYAFTEPADSTRPDLPRTIDVLACSPKPGLLLISAEVLQLTGALDRMKKLSPPRKALPGALLEWQFVDKDARFWAIRHLGHSSDPSLPPGAIGVTVSYKQHDDSVKLTYLFTEDRFDMLKSFGQTWNIPIQTDSVTPGVSSARIVWNDQPGFPTPLYSLLGHVLPAI